MRSNSNGCLATSGENAEEHRGLHKLTENPLSKEWASFSVMLGLGFIFFNTYRSLINMKIRGTHKGFKNTAV